MMKRRRRGCGCIPTLLILVVLIVAGYGLDRAADAVLFAPWAYGWFGRPTLTGDWNGTLTSLGGTRYGIHLQLSRSGQALSGPRAPDIDGSISWCTHNRPGATATLHGTSDRSASDVKLDVHLPDHPHPGLIPSHLEGAWHDPTLALRVLFTLYQNHHYLYSTAISDEMRPVRLTLRKGGFSAYQESCARL